MRHSIRRLVAALLLLVPGASAAQERAALRAGVSPLAHDAGAPAGAPLRAGPDGRSRARGALAGAGIGLLAGAGIGLVVALVSTQGDDRDGMAGLALVAVPTVGAGIGAAVGAVVGLIRGA